MKTLTPRAWSLSHQLAQARQTARHVAVHVELVAGSMPIRGYACHSTIAW